MQNKHKSQPVFNGKNLRVGVVTARFNKAITKELERSALEALKKNKVGAKKIKVVSVAGCVEIPYALLKMAETKKYDCLVAIGCVVRGETPHFDYVAKMVQEGVLEVSLEESIPIGFGVLTVNTVEQAEERYHVGGEAAAAAIEGALLVV